MAPARRPRPTLAAFLQQGTKGRTLSDAIAQKIVPATTLRDHVRFGRELGYRHLLALYDWCDGAFDLEATMRAVMVRPTEASTPTAQGLFPKHRKPGGRSPHCVASGMSVPDPQPRAPKATP